MFAFCKDNVTIAIMRVIAIFDRIYYICCMTTYIKSPFPYAGCKYNLLEELDKVIPAGDTLIDMFGGSGVVGVNMAYKFQHVIYNDIMEPLVFMHRNMFIDSLETILQNARDLSSKIPEKYAELRNAYNNLIEQVNLMYYHDTDDRWKEIGYRFFGLMLSCTNNLVRFNKKGGFNQTCGKRQLTDPKVIEITAWKQKLTDIPKETHTSIMFNNCSYEAYGNMDDGTVVYADPPYSNTEAGYNGGWTVDDDVKLARFIMNHMRYKWIVSSCAKDGNTTKLVENLRASGAFDERRIDYNYKASKKTKESKTEEIILVSK